MTMKDHLIPCPLCNFEIPFDSDKCSHCGALLAPGPSRTTPILKGIVCSRCGARNYNYDSCDHCGHRFSKTCLSCGEEIPLKETTCPACGFSGRRPVAGGRRMAGGEDDDVTPPRPVWMTWGLPIAAAVVVVILALAFALRPSSEQPAAEPGPQTGEARAVDTDGDGSPDYWNVYGDHENVIERRRDENHDGIIEKVEFFDKDGNPKYAHIDADGDGQAEQVHAFSNKGVLSMVYHYQGGAFDVPSRMERYNATGHMIERWNDKDFDGVWDHYQRYDLRGRLLVEGTDTKQNGFIDRYLVYRDNQEIFQRMYDADGDGIVEKIESLNAQGIRVIMEEDTDVNGMIDKKTFYHLTGTIRWVQLDANNDGIYETFQSHSKEGKLARTGFDTNGDSKPDSWK